MKGNAMLTQSVSVRIVNKPVRLQIMSEEVQAFLEWLQLQPRIHWTMYIDAYALYLRNEYGELAEIEAIEWASVADEYKTEQGKVRRYRFVDSVNTDVLDVTGLELEASQELSRTLRYWNGPGPVYRKRYGRRYLDRRIQWIDLEHPTIKALSGYEDLLHACKQEPIYHEPIHLMRAA